MDFGFDSYMDEQERIQDEHDLAEWYACNDFSYTASDPSATPPDDDEADAEADAVAHAYGRGIDRD